MRTELLTEHLEKKLFDFMDRHDMRKLFEKTSRISPGGAICGIYVVSAATTSFAYHEKPLAPRPPSCCDAWPMPSTGLGPPRSQRRAIEVRSRMVQYCGHSHVYDEAALKGVRYDVDV